MDIDHIIQGRVAAGLFPHVAGQHLAGDNMAPMAQQILQEFELTGSEIQRLSASRYGSTHDIHFKIRDPHSRARLGHAPSAESPDPSEQFRKGKRFYQIIVGAGYPGLARDLRSHPLRST